MTRRIDRYSSSVEEMEIEVCFFDLQEIGEPPRVVTNPLTDLRESMQEPQSASQKAIKLSEGSARKYRP